ncbi:MAG: hypothetical protein ACLQSR_16170 [Limisphaerales bacterium]
MQTLRQAVENFCQTCQLTMNNQSQKHAKAGQLARSAELKPSASAVAAHKHLVDARIISGRRPPRNRSQIPLASIGHCGRKFTTAFCFILQHLPVCLQAGFQLDGRIDGLKKKTLCSKNELCLLKAS